MQSFGFNAPKSDVRVKTYFFEKGKKVFMSFRVFVVIILYYNHLL